MKETEVEIHPKDTLNKVHIVVVVRISIKTKTEDMIIGKVSKSTLIDTLNKDKD